MYLMITNIATRTTFIFERARKGSRKLNAYSMPADLPVLDSRIPWRSVPLHIRREARATFA